MSKSFYSDFVAHITRFYFVWDSSKGFRSPQDQENYNAVKVIMEDIPQLDRDIIRTVYSGSKPTSALRNDGSVYQLLNWYEKKVAQARGLIAK